jgi:hypothetical protein
MCEYCAFVSTNKKYWLNHMKSDHLDVFNQLVKDQRLTIKVLNTALANVSSDDDDSTMKSTFSPPNTIETTTPGTLTYHVTDEFQSHSVSS